MHRFKGLAGPPATQAKSRSGLRLAQFGRQNTPVVVTAYTKRALGSRATSCFQASSGSRFEVGCDNGIEIGVITTLRTALAVAICEVALMDFIVAAVCFLRYPNLALNSFCVPHARPVRLQRHYPPGAGCIKSSGRLGAHFARGQGRAPNMPRFIKRAERSVYARCAEKSATRAGM